MAKSASPMMEGLKASLLTLNDVGVWCTACRIQRDGSWPSPVWKPACVIWRCDWVALAYVKGICGADQNARSKRSRRLQLIVRFNPTSLGTCLLYTSDAADDLTRVDLGGRRILKK